MRIKIIAAILLLFVSLSLMGCTSLTEMFGVGEAEEEPLMNGTTTGNILNGGFAVKDGEDLLVYYTGGEAYPKGSLVRSNPGTGESSLVLDKAGLYMNMAGGVLYYSLDDGIYRMPLDTPQPERMLEGDCSLLQISKARMYYVSGGTVGCTALDGSAVTFTPIDDAACLNVYGGSLYYIDVSDGRIWKANMDGTNKGRLYDKAVDMFYIIDDVIYYIDGADGQLKRISLELDEETHETLTEKPCSGFNVNRQGLYYTLKDDRLCYNAGPDGFQAQVVSGVDQSAWHRICVFGEGALVVRQEDLPS